MVFRRGRLLGPCCCCFFIIIYVIYMNDLSEVTLYSKCKMYADDIRVCVPGRDASEIESKINLTGVDLNTVNSWFTAIMVSRNNV